MHINTIVYNPSDDTLTFLLREVACKDEKFTDTISFLLQDTKDGTIPVGLRIAAFAETLRACSGKLRWHADGQLRLLEMLADFHRAEGASGKMHWEDRPLFDQKYYTAYALVQDAAFRPDQILAMRDAFIAEHSP